MRAAMWQAHCGGSVRDNLMRLAGAMKEASTTGVDVLVTPEMFLTGYNIGPDACRELAVSLADPLMTQICSLSRDSGVGLVLGYPERGGDGNVYNSAVLIDAGGEVLVNYRKTHLFGDLDHARFSAGQELPDPVDFAGMRVALAICYDIEFPELVRKHAMQGAEVVLVPTANWLVDVNDRLVPARAQENRVYVLYVNFVGTEEGLEYCGQSRAAAPSGSFVASAGGEVELTVVELSTEAVSAERDRIDYLADRRPDLYP